MRTEQHGHEFGVATIAPSPDVARRVDTRLQSSAPHDLHYVCSARHIGIREADTADPIWECPSGRAAKNAQLLKVSAQSCGVDLRSPITPCRHNQTGSPQ